MKETLLEQTYAKLCGLQQQSAFIYGEVSRLSAAIAEALKTPSDGLALLQSQVDLDAVAKPPPPPAPVAGRPAARCGERAADDPMWWQEER